MAPAKILIVEDEVVVAMELQGILSAIGYTVAGAVRSGEEAIETVRQTNPDLVLMDVRLVGEMDGIEAARVIRERFNIPVIYVTAHADEETVQRAKRTLPLGFIVKPFTQSDLRAGIEVALFKHEQDTQVREASECLATTLGVLGGAVILADADGVVRNMSSVAETLTGWKAKEAIGRQLAEVYVLRDEDTGEIVRNPLSLMHLKSEYVPTSSKYVLISRNATPIPIVNTITGISDSEGRMTEVIVAFQDSSQMVMPEQFWNSYASNLHLSGLLLNAQGHHSRAESCFKRALLIWERNLGSEHPKVSRALEGLAEVCERTGRLGEAKELQAKAAAIRAGVPLSSP